MSIAIANILLNFYLVPFAGIFGAACATLISMIAYFIAFDVFLDKSHKIKKWSYLSAAAGVYLIYMLMRTLNFGLISNVILTPIILFLVFFGIGFFNVEANALHNTLDRQRLIEGGNNNGRLQTGRPESV